LSDKLSVHRASARKGDACVARPARDAGDQENRHMTDQDNPSPPDDLPVNSEQFFSAAGDLNALSRPPALDPPAPALQRLGAPPFSRSKFPFLGFLASVYDHVAAHARGRQPKHESR
jgi:hypothetical protein